MSYDFSVRVEYVLLGALVLLFGLFGPIHAITTPKWVFEKAGLSKPGWVVIQLGFPLIATLAYWLAVVPRLRRVRKRFT